MALDGKQVGTFEGLDGTSSSDVPAASQGKWDQGRWIEGKSFVWEVDATQKMRKASRSKTPQVLPPFEDFDPNYSLDFGKGSDDSENATVASKRQRLGFSDLHKSDELAVLSGDAEAQLGDVSDLTVGQVFDHVGARMDAVGIVEVGPKGGFKRAKLASGVHHSVAVEPTVEVDRGIWQLMLAMGQNAIGVSRNGRVDGKGGRNRKTDEMPAIVEDLDLDHGAMA